MAVFGGRMAVRVASRMVPTSASQMRSMVSMDVVRKFPLNFGARPLSTCISGTHAFTGRLGRASVSGNTPAQMATALFARRLTSMVSSRVHAITLPIVDTRRCVSSFGARQVSAPAATYAHCTHISAPTTITPESIFSKTQLPTESIFSRTHDSIGV